MRRPSYGRVSKDSLYLGLLRNLSVMTDTSSSLPVCIHCGTPRPADETLCPNCGKPWIDVSISDATPSTEGTAVVAATASTVEQSASEPPPPSPTDDTGEFDFDDWTLPPDPKPSKAKWLIPLLLLVAVVSVWALVFVDRDSTVTRGTIAAAETTTTQVTQTTAALETATTQPQTTTSSTTQTTVAYPAADAWETTGEPIPVPELKLKASGIGPVAFGSPITASAGAFVASLGQAETSGLGSDLCASEQWYWLEWGGLRTVFDGYTDDAQFIAYRYENAGQDESSPMLETLSGIRLGDTVESLQATYTSYTVSFEVINGKDHFRLSDGGELLLWGPVTSTEPQGTVEGIYSPDPCQSSS
ncbi:MAG: hypothetical protein BMS9Abin12_0226 [Acidimicrobiia bacterium]|nr:MAG: hypothetical protein BMS9Abin12_0226 [Acidimicrobiia bacterium]